MRCEEFVNKYLPTVKAEIVDVLYNDYDITQVEISEVLNITQPAVSQYIAGDRGGNKELEEDILYETEKTAKKLYEMHESGEVTEEKLDDLMCDICKKI